MTKAIDLCDYKAVQELYKEIIAKWAVWTCSSTMPAPTTAPG